MFLGVPLIFFCIFLVIFGYPKTSPKNLIDFNNFSMVVFWVALTSSSGVLIGTVKQKKIKFFWFNFFGLSFGMNEFDFYDSFCQNFF